MWRCLWSGLVLVFVLAGVARAEPRIALVIGNGGYAHVNPLDNPPEDARLMSATLVSLGFKVTLIRNASLAELAEAVSQFGKQLREAGPEATGLFYYAGHGVQSFGSNFLVPVDASLTDAADLGLVALDAESVLRQMSSAKNHTNIVILDACRNNPFETVPDMEDTGLAEMKAPKGTFLAYSTAPGAVALDGLAANSPFTAALAALITSPGMPIEQMFKEVRKRVLDETKGMQTPWDASSLTADFSFAPISSLAAEGTDAAGVWAAIKAAPDPIQVLLFLRNYPDDPNVPEARNLLASLMSQEIVPGAAPAPAAAVAPAPAPAAPVAEGAAAPIPPLPEVAAGSVSFHGALAVGDATLDGKSLAELITASPLFPPIDGLPDEAWKGHQCSACHQWTQAALCDQSKTYTTATAERSLSKQHPLGLTFKQALKQWAAAGCP